MTLSFTWKVSVSWITEHLKRNTSYKKALIPHKLLDMFLCMVNRCYMWLLCVKQARIPADTRHTHLQASYCQVQSELLELPVETVKG